MMQRALSFAHSVRALQRAHLLPPEVCQHILRSRGLHGAGFDSPKVAAAVAGRSQRGRSAASGLREVEAAPEEEAEAEAAGPSPALPLCERAAQHPVPLSELLAWAESATRRVEAVGDSWAEADEGPCEEDLQVCMYTNAAAGLTQGLLAACCAKLLAAYEARCSTA